MTSDKTRKKKIRAAQVATGARYTVLARQFIETGALHPFTLRELLHECTTAGRPSQVPCDCPDPECWSDQNWAPPAFDSTLLGGVAVPNGSVLELAGVLAYDDIDAQLRVEHVRPWVNAVITCGTRRFNLVLNQAWFSELCQQPHCPSTITNPVTWCLDHLHERTPAELVDLARTWGHWRFEEAGSDPSGHGGPGAEPLVQAAVTQGCVDQVCETIVRSSFPDSLFEDDFLDGPEALALRHCSERERLRLHQVAAHEGRRQRVMATA